MHTDDPIRSCVACRTRRPQAALVRVARQADGSVHVDEGARRGEGRGAYLCPTQACIDLAERRQTLKRVLRGEVPVTVYAAVRRVSALREQSA